MKVLIDTNIILDLALIRIPFYQEADEIFTLKENIFTKEFPLIETILKVDFKAEKLIYPTEKGFTISGDFTTSFKKKENFVVFECVCSL